MGELEIAVVEHNEVIITTIESNEVPGIGFEVLCQRGDFGFGGQMYHHDRIDLETAKRLIARGYPYLQLI